MGKSSTGMEENIAGFLCYLGGLLTGIIFYALEKESRFVKFHALQSMITFGIMFVLHIVLSFIPVIGWAISLLINLVMLVVWIVCMIKAFQGQTFKLPIVGDIAERQLF